MTITAKINRRRLMAFAWDWARHQAFTRRTGKPSLYLSDALKAAWANERAILAHETAKAAVAPRPVHVIRAEIVDLETRDRLGAFGLARLSTLASELRAAA